MRYAHTHSEKKYSRADILNTKDCEDIQSTKNIS